MHGTMLVFAPRTMGISEITFDRAPTLEELKGAIGGGYLEAVPGFDSVIYNDIVMSCVALCDEDGKRKRLDLNAAASIAWDRALRRQGETLVDLKTSRARDYLVGSVVVLFGDKEFMGSL